MVEQISEEEYGRRRRELRLELNSFRMHRDAARESGSTQEAAYWGGEMHKVIERQKELDAIAPDWPGPQEIPSAPTVAPEQILVQTAPASKFGTAFVETEAMLAALSGDEDHLLSIIRALLPSEAARLAGAAQIIVIAASMRSMEDK